ncbi:beta-glucosidase family protein [Clostridium cellulovorans]|uniref:Glycoside hydrolase family 3 domain protein n=2 Tax=Clostridium cellulovorans TaxID=1493 RepID=D9SMN9_CLOC7|nr:glycoside hydrolase family 3 C-terminal domain-containing protein [Clostridium cellulovorans]ADL49824.1 glycoside hydrolase family 3 domain protein [Clostridium cellulovorans 743B]BAV13087.1 beta-glucosidase [Clostridium cellulovorans]
MDIGNKIKELIEMMTLEEKVAMIHGNGLFKTGGVPRLGIPPLIMSDGPMGVRRDFYDDNWIAINNTDDFVTYLPSNTALAATWNINLAYKAGQVLGNEARGRGKDVILAPGVNILRSPVCGRNYEYISEDPYLTARMAVAIIKGIQENDVAACVKHFAVNNQETNRLKIDVDVDDRALREIYFPAFDAAINEADPYTLMGAYNKLRGIHASHSDYLLNRVLKGEWNYGGVVISDWGAVHDTYEAVYNGLDIEMNVTTNFTEYFMADPLIKEVNEGKIEEKSLDDKISRILKLMFKLKMFDDNRYDGEYNTLEHKQRVLEIARESITLLKNEGKLLPLDRKKIKRLVVIGENGDRIHSPGGDSAAIKALYEVTPLSGIRMKFGGNTKIEYFKGYSSEEKDNDKILFDEAVIAAKGADAVVFVGGINHDFDTEGFDKPDLVLPYGQDDLIKELLKVNKNTVVVMICGTPVEMSQWLDMAPAVIHSSYAGMEGGTALAEVLLGNVNPSGKLPVTFPKTLMDSPAHKIGEFPGEQTVHYKEGLYVGYRYFDTYKVEPLFCFGHGLSYTTFEYSDMEVSKEEKDNDIKVIATFKVKNTGTVAGAEVIQGYVRDTESQLERPEKELKAFAKVFLQPQEIKSVELEFDKKSFAYYNNEEAIWVCEEGNFELLIAASSQDIRLKDNVSIYKTIKY